MIRGCACLVVMLTLVAGGIAGCGRGGPKNSAPSSVASSETPRPIDTLLMAYLSKARALHHEADLHEQAGDPRAAIVDLERLVATPVPGNQSPAPEAQEVLADTLARLADLRGQLGDFEAAERDIERGLQRAPKQSYFEGHLVEIRGVGQERRAKRLSEQGDSKGAEQARRKAIELFDEAIRIQDQVINKALLDAGGPRE